VDQSERMKVGVLSRWGGPSRKFSWRSAFITVGLFTVLMLCSVGPFLVAEEHPEDQVSEVRSPAPAVTVTGTCEKKILGGYGLLASITVFNATPSPVLGNAWVSWDVLGAKPRVYTKVMTVDAGGKKDFFVDEPMDQDLWFRVSATCNYGWTPSGDGGGGVR
jgi:hypothetical protein